MAIALGPEAALRAGARSGPLRSVVVTIVVGLTLTFLIAHLEQLDAQRERELRFGREAEAIQQTVSARIEDLSERFETARAFIGATHPLPAAVYTDYFRRGFDYGAPIDPGILLVEEVDRADLDELEARERRLGDPDFEVKGPGLTTPGDALVVTRASAEGDMAFPLIGHDISFSRSLIIPPDGAGGDSFLRVAESASLLAGASSLDLVGSAEIPTVSPFFVGQAVDADGDRVGWAMRFLSPEQLTDGVILPDHVNVQLSVRGISGPIAAVPPSPLSSADTADLYEQRIVTAAGQAWTMEVWSDPEFGGPVGFRTQRAVIGIGMAATVALALAIGGWEYYRRRLAGASFELAHARTLATTDHLTGLLNRQGLIDGARAHAATEKATLYFVDLDGFKTINDERGHNVGDVLLAAVGRELRDCFRQEDLVARLGGDEFVAFTVGEGGDNNARLIAERVVDRIGAIDPKVSCSLGVAHRPPGDGADVKDLLRMADEAMYSAKRTGGDRFVIAAR